MQTDEDSLEVSKTRYNIILTTMESKCSAKFFDRCPNFRLLNKFFITLSMHANHFKLQY